jgi:serine-type D-Ala-D-Ala carboxypeptidase/endopeptidase (penicillin-binding protein 4)
VRRLVLPLILLLVAVAGLGTAVAVERPERAAAVEPLEVASTPVWSPRRVPRWLVTPAADDRLRLAVQPVIDQAPPDTCLVVTERGRVVVSQQPDLVVVPASNQKLVTAHVVLETLGPDHTYRTAVVAPSGAVDGVVAGDLWLVGGGDPVLVTADFAASFDPPAAATSLEDLADRIVAAGVERIDGSIVGDASRYDDQTDVPGWPVRDYGTAAPGPLLALAVNRGFSSYATDPEAIVIPSRAPDAPAAAAQRLRELLVNRGVTVTGGARSGSVATDGLGDDTTEIAAIESPPLVDIVATMLTESDNTVAELLLKELAVADGREGSSEQGLEVLREVVAGLDLPAQDAVFADGSGLHDANRLRCSFVIGLLDRLGPDSVIAEGLPRSGETGTLHDRLDGPLAGALRAKTGSLRETTALSGFAEAFEDIDLTFAFIANAPDVPDSVLDLQELLGTVLVRYPEGPSLAELAPR